VWLNGMYLQLVEHQFQQEHHSQRQVSQQQLLIK
jgi:hypothetical protein